jgi:hypothetical protein
MTTTFKLLGYRSLVAAVLAVGPCPILASNPLLAQQDAPKGGPTGVKKGPPPTTSQRGPAPTARTAPQERPVVKSQRSADRSTAIAESRSRQRTVEKPPSPPSTQRTAGRPPPPAAVAPQPQHADRRHRRDRRHAHRPWRPGLAWRWITVPTLYFAEELEWCHVHRYRAAGMRFHDDVECHRHTLWDHPSIRYVEAED